MAPWGVHVHYPRLSLVSDLSALLMLSFLCFHRFLVICVLRPVVNVRLWPSLRNGWRSMVRIFLWVASIL